MAADILISCSPTDSTSADALQRGLAEAGLSCWIARRGVPLGEDWAESVRSNIRDVKAVVAIVSRASIVSTHVEAEVEIATRAGIEVIAVRIEDVPLTGALRSVGMSLNAFPPPIDRYLRPLVESIWRMVATKRDLVVKILPPTELELSRIPRWAKVAFAARCARRVQPLAKGASRIAAVEAAITAAEASARRGAERMPSEIVEACTSAVFAADTTIDRSVARAAEATALAAAKVIEPASAAAARAAQDAYVAAAQQIVDPGLSPLSEMISQAVSQPFGPGVIHVGPDLPVSASIAEPIRLDLNLLTMLAKEHRWTDTTPVDPDCLGALWPVGPPPGWPVDRRPARQEVLIELVVPENTSDEELDVLVQQHALAADALHAASGGSGLKVDTVEVYQESRLPSEVLS